VRLLVLLLNVSRNELLVCGEVVRPQNAITFATAGKCAPRDPVRSKQIEKKSPGNVMPANIAGRRQTSLPLEKIGAGEGARTLDPDLGKVVLYH
jgi:hypothetical protein